MNPQTTIHADEEAGSNTLAGVRQHQAALDYDLRRRIVNFLVNCRISAPLNFEITNGIVQLPDRFASQEERDWFAETCYRHGAKGVEFASPAPR